jgi:flavin-dependent dehydrogenase
VIPRRVLDQALLEHTLTKGITFLDETKALGATIDRQGVTVACVNHNRRYSVQARVVLAGDGSIAPFSRRLGLVRERPNVIAVRTYVRGDRLDVDAYHIFFLTHLLPNYGWIFPVASGRFNVGIGIPVSKLRQKEINLRRAFRDFLSSHGARQVIGTCNQVEPARVHAIRMPGLCPNQLAAERILAMGDAASMANPLSGEGIGPALDSGMIAAEHVCRAFQEGHFSQERLSSYSVEIQSRYGADYRAASILKRLLTKPLVVNGAARLGRSESQFAQLLAQAVLSRSAKQLLRPDTLLKSTFYWPLRATLQSSRKPERAT